MKKTLVFLLFMCGLLLPLSKAGAIEYNALTSPPPNLPVVVKLGLNFLDLVAIHEYEETFTADIYLFSEWKDPRLAYSAPEGSFPKSFVGDACKDKLKEIWWPDFEFVNCGTPEYTNNFLVIHPDGTVNFNQGITATFRNQFDYRKLPFDKQRLKIILSSFSWNDKVVAFQPLTEKITAAQKMKAVYEEIKILGLEIDGHQEVNSYNPTPSGYSEFVVTLTTQRAPLFYSYQVFFPLLVVIGLCCCVFYIPPQMIGDRISIVLTCVLVFIATKFLINQDLPKIGYLTFVDKVFFIAYFFAGAVAITCIAEHHFWKRDPVYAERIPRVARIAGPILFLITCFILVLTEII